MTTFINPYTYIADPVRGRPVFNGRVFIGNINTDPVQPENRVTVSVVNENGTLTAIPQPIITGPGGVATFQGNPVQLDVAVVQHSITIQNSLGAQVYYSPRVNIVGQATVPTDQIDQFAQFGTPRFITSAANGGNPFVYPIGARVVYNPGTGDRVYESLENNNTALPTDETMWRQVDTTGIDIFNDVRYLNAASNLSDLAAVATARASLGLGTAATRNIGTGVGQIPTRDNFPATLGVTGRFTLPNGVVFQWGSVSNPGSGDAGFTFTFPVAFPASCFVFYVIPYPTSESSSQDWWSQTISFSRTSGRFYYQSVGAARSRRVLYLAIGN